MFSFIRKGSPRQGFTLMELMVALAVSSVILLALGKSFSISNRSYIAQDQVAFTEQNLRAAIEIMAFELRMAGYIPLDNLPDGDYEITTDVSGQNWSDGSFDRIEYAAVDGVALTADLNPDDNPATVDYAETVLYQLIGTDLVRRSWQWNPGGGSWTADTAAPVTMAENITGLVLGYTFKDGTSGPVVPGDPDHDRDNIRAVTITLSGETARPIQMKETGAEVVQRTLQSVVMMRNMDLDPTVAQSY